LNFLETLKKQVIVLDGAMGTMTQALDLNDNDYGGGDFKMLGDLLSFSRPEAIEQIHVDYFRAGANMVETNTFGASPMRLSEYQFADADLSTFAPIPYGLDVRSATYEELAYALSRRGAELACAAKERYAQESDYDGRPLFVAGSIGPSNRVLSKTDADLQESTFEAIGENFRCQVAGLIDGGADVVLFETQQDILELKAAVLGALEAMKEKQTRLPIIAQVSVDQFSRMQIFHTDIHAALVTVADIGVDVFGINCSIGPDLMGKTVEKMSRFSPLPISVVPNAGLPVSEDGQTVYSFSPERFAEYQYEFVTKFGANIVGGCCGTSPDHIRALAERVSGLAPAAREPDRTVYLSGPQEAISLDSSDALIKIGERLNVRGSLKVRQAVETEGAIDNDALEEVVEEQIGGLGLSVIDVCMDSNLVDTVSTLKHVVHTQTADFSGAMSLDSFDVEALCEAIKVYPGRPIVNSMSLEEVSPGVTKIDAVCEATNAHGPVYVGLCAGPKGPAATREDKCDLAKQIVENAAKHGVVPGRILIDMNVFPLGSESDPSMNFAIESLEAIPLIKAIHPDLKTVCGVGNLTNGLAKKPYMRKVLTSVWLDEARKRGLDAAIVNPNHYVFVENLEKKDYELALDAILRRDMEAFEELERIAVAKTGVTVERRTSYGDLPAEEAIVRKVIDGYKDRVSGQVEVDGHDYAYADTIVLQTVEVVATQEPLAFINDYLMVGMQELGDGFARGDVSLPHLLKSADVMKQVMGFLEEFLRVRSGVDIHDEIKYKGVIVLGTVYQDVHSIGKDLAKTLFENYGYRVIDLGVMTPLQGYIDAAKEHKADAIGMSALLVQTSNHMITVSKMMLEQDMHDTHVLIGGAPVSDRHAAYVAMAGEEDEEAMRSNVFYCPTAMDGVNVMNELATSERVHEVLELNVKKLRSRLKRAQQKAQKDEELLQNLPRRVISMESRPILTNPWVKPERIDVALTDFRPYIDKRNLFSLNWKFGGASKRKAQSIPDDYLEKLFVEWTEKAGREGWLLPQGVIGVFPCRAQGDDVVVYDIDDQDRELCRFSFTKVIGSGREDTVCAAQYFYPEESEQVDAIGIQISSTGPQIDEQLATFKEEGDSESALFLQGLSDRLAEDMAEYLHNMIKARLGFEGQKIGTRWSPGYPAITNTEHNMDIAQLLGAPEKIGISITDAGEFYPTGCTGAVISFHPEARYS
jgi:5-methyltetrahydrofolate--homocysteine methyltransferase